MADLNAVADVLEKTAVLLDAIDSEKQAAIRTEREQLLSVMCSKYSEATGEEVSDAMKEKLANANTDVISLIEKLAESSPGNEELGSPSDRKDPAAPQTIKEASVAADDQFLDWVLS